jgi:hypothetical protein
MKLYGTRTLDANMRKLLEKIRAFAEGELMQDHLLGSVTEMTPVSPK